MSASSEEDAGHTRLLALSQPSLVAWPMRFFYAASFESLTSVGNDERAKALSDNVKG